MVSILKSFHNLDKCSQSVIQRISEYFSLQWLLINFYWKETGRERQLHFILPHTENENNTRAGSSVTYFKKDKQH